MTAMDMARLLYSNTPPRKLNQAKENIEKILLKLFREGKAYCWKNKEEAGVTPGGLPKFGYIHYMDEHLCWQLKPVVERMRDGGGARH